MRTSSQRAKYWVQGLDLNQTPTSIAKSIVITIIESYELQAQKRTMQIQFGGSGKKISAHYSVI